MDEIGVESESQSDQEEKGEEIQDGKSKRKRSQTQHYGSVISSDQRKPHKERSTVKKID